MNSDTKSKILEACHNDRVGGCHFGRDKTAFKMQSHLVQCFEMEVLSPFPQTKKKVK